MSRHVPLGSPLFRYRQNQLGYGHFAAKDEKAFDKTVPPALLPLQKQRPFHVVAIKGAACAVNYHYPSFAYHTVSLSEHF